MKRIHYLLLILLIVSCSENRIDPYNNRIRVEGRVVETYYSENIIFSVRPLINVKLRIGDTYITETNGEGKYNFNLYKDGQYYLFAEKENYRTNSMRLDLIKGIYRERDFHLEKVDEGSHGWVTFPATGDGGKVAITADGLCIFSGGREHVYATKTIRVANNNTYRFIANLRKDPATQMIYFAIMLQIPGHEWIYDYWNINNWRISEIVQKINDTTILDVSYIYDDDGNIIDTVYTYPEFVDVVLKIGVEQGTNFPTGYFREIRVEGD